MYSKLHHPSDSLSFSWKKSIWLYLFLIPSLIFFWDAFTFKLGLISLALMIITVSLGHSAGLHRGIIHRSYQTSRLLRGLLAYLDVHAGLGSPVEWIKLHYVRDYWQNQIEPPRYFQYHHSLATDYWWYLHLTYTPNKLDRYHIPDEDLHDPWLRWLDKTWWMHVLAACGLVWHFFGFDAMIVCMTTRISLTILGHWFIGYVTHTYGYRHFDIQGSDNSGTNVWLLGLISFGEGFHNNHHAYPQSARFGIKWYEFDVSWYLIVLFRKLGLVWDVKEAEKDEHILKPNAIASQKNNGHHRM